MDLTPVSRSGAVILTPASRIDHSSADAFQAALQPHLDRCVPGETSIVLDMHQLEYISSVGLRVLMMAARQVKAQKGRIALARLNPLVREVFEISRFDLVFDTFDNVDAALTAARGAG